MLLQFYSECGGPVSVHGEHPFSRPFSTYKLVKIEIENTRVSGKHFASNKATCSISEIVMTSPSSSKNGDLHSEKPPLDPATTRENAHTAFDSIPDGGFQAWMQVAAAFFIFMNTAGVFSSYGVYQGFYTQGPLKSISGSNISWIGSLQGCLMLLISIVTGPLYDLGYLHSLVNMGTFAIVFGMMVTSICREYWQFFLAQGVMVGVGNGLLFLPSIAIVPQYFSENKALASGIVAAGSCIGAFFPTKSLPTIPVLTLDVSR